MPIYGGAYGNGSEEFYRNTQSRRQPSPKPDEDEYLRLMREQGDLARTGVQTAGDRNAQAIRDEYDLYSKLPVQIVDAYLKGAKYSQDKAKTQSDLDLNRAKIDIAQAEEARAADKYAADKPFDQYKRDEYIAGRGPRDEAARLKNLSEQAGVDKTLEETQGKMEERQFMNPDRRLQKFNNDMANDIAKRRYEDSQAEYLRRHAAQIGAEEQFLDAPPSPSTVYPGAPVAPNRLQQVPKSNRQRKLDAEIGKDERSGLKGTPESAVQKAEDEGTKQAVSQATKTLSEARAHRDSIKAKAVELENIVKKYGTTGRAENMLSPGSAPEDMDKLVYQIAIEQAKLADPSTAAREGEVESARKYSMPIRKNYGLGMTNDTAIDIIRKNARDADNMVAVREAELNRLLGKHGPAQPDDISQMDEAAIDREIAARKAKRGGR